MPELFCRMHLVLSRKYQNSSPYAGTIPCWQVVLSLSEPPWALSFHFGAWRGLRRRPGNANTCTNVPHHVARNTTWRETLTGVPQSLTRSITHGNSVITSDFQQLWIILGYQKYSD